MSKPDRDTIKNLTQLSRIDCSEEEQEAMLKDLQNILEYFKLLDEVDTNGVAACNHVLEDIGNVLREDAVANILPREKFLANVPSQIGGMVKVPPVIKPA